MFNYAKGLSKVSTRFFSL